MKMKAGKYFLGDPCYVPRSDDYWTEFCDHLDDVGPDEKFVTEVKKTEVVVWAESTRYGDGVYRDKHGFEYSVDSGLIGLTTLKHLNGLEINELVNSGLGRIIEYEADFDAYRDREYTFNINTADILIPTDFDDEYEYDDDLYDDQHDPFYDMDMNYDG